MSLRFQPAGAMMASAALLALMALSVHAAEHEVSANPGFTFTPRELDIRVGDTVRFLNRGGLHNVVADDGRFRCAQGCDDGNPSVEPWSFSLNFEAPGEIPYYCEVHGAAGGRGMSGLIRVAAERFEARLTGAEQVPAMASRATGHVELRLAADGASLDYRLQLTGFDSPVTTAQLEMGQTGVNGGLVAVLCGGGGRPDCESEQMLSGRLQVGDIQGPQAQGLNPGELPALLRALQQGSIYVKVSSERYGMGEIRGQLNPTVAP